MSIKEYRSLINKATTKEELRDITYKAFLEDDNALSGKRTLYNKVVTLAVKREMALKEGAL